MENTELISWAKEALAKESLPDNIYLVAGELIIDSKLFLSTQLTRIELGNERQRALSLEYLKLFQKYFT